jgi:RND family efflux transporter MFP subunit
VFEAVLQPASTYTVRARAAGLVAAVRVEVGDPVAAGDTLVELESHALRLEREGAELVGEQARIRLERLRILHGRGLLAAQELEQAEFAARTAALRLEQAGWALAQTVVTAPQAGRVSQLQAVAGGYLSAGEACLTVMGGTGLLAELPVPADQLVRVGVGQRAVATLEAVAAATNSGGAGAARKAAMETITKGAAGGRRPRQPAPLAGRVCRLAPVVDPVSGTCTAVVQFPDAGRRVLPGTVVRIQLLEE